MNNYDNVSSSMSLFQLIYVCIAVVLLLAQCNDAELVGRSLEISNQVTLLSNDDNSQLPSYLKGGGTNTIRRHGRRTQELGNSEAIYLYDDVEISSPVIEYKTGTEVGLMLFDNRTNPNQFQYVTPSDPNEYRVIHFYDSRPSYCSVCLDLHEHYVKLAQRMSEMVHAITTTRTTSVSTFTTTPPPVPTLKLSVYAVSCAHTPDLCRSQDIDTKKLPVIRLYSPSLTTANSDTLATPGIDINYHSIHPYHVLDKLGMLSKINEVQTLSLSSISRKSLIRVDQLNPEFEEEHWNNVVTFTDPKRQQHSLNTKKKVQVAPISMNLESIRNPILLESDINLVLDHLFRNYIHQSYTTSQQLPVEGQKEGNRITQYYPVSSELVPVLQEFLMLLQKTLPQSWKIHSVIRNIIVNLMYVTNDRNYLLSLLDEYHIGNPLKSNAEVGNQKWSPYCTEYNTKNLNITGPPEEGHDGNDHDNEYSCGFWELLHTISMGVVEYNLMAYDGTERIVTHTAMETMKGFIQSFNGGGFNLIERSTLFYMYDTCFNDACNRLQFIPGGSENMNNWMQLSLWLLEMQNYLNAQMYKRYSYRAKQVPTLQEQMKVQYPSIQLCPNCWMETKKKSKDQDVLLSLNNDDMISKYLRLRYGSTIDQTTIDDYFRMVMTKQPDVVMKADNDSHQTRNETKNSIPIQPPFQIRSSSILILAFLGIVFRLRIFLVGNQPGTQKRGIRLMNMDEYNHSKLC